MSSTYRPQLVLPVSPERDHIRGPVDAPIILLEYGDYECPYCGAAHPVVQELRRLMGNQMSVVYRHFPLTNVHPHAESAAEAAEAAGAQRRFWAMHDMLFEHQDALEVEDIIGYAEPLGLDVPRFVRELSDGTYRPRVREDFLSGVRSGVNGTPTFYVNGLRHDGPADLQSLLWSIQHVRAA
jgi:protein-disulfide isomerase